MNKLQMRQTLETILGYYDYSKDNTGIWTRTESVTCPGYYHFEGEPFKPAFFMEGGIRVPTSWDPKGLETIMMEVPKPRAFNLPGGMLERWQTWTVWIRQWDREKTIADAQLAILRHFGEEATANGFIENDRLLGDRVKITITTKDFDLRTYNDGSLVSNPPSPIENSPFKSYFEQ